MRRKRVPAVASLSHRIVCCALRILRAKCTHKRVKPLQIKLSCTTLHVTQGQSLMTLIRADVCSVCCLHSQMNKSPLQRDAHTFFCSALIDNEDAQRETSTLSKVALTCFDSGPDSSWEDCGNYLFTISANISDFVILSFGNTILLLLFETSFLYAQPVFVNILVAYLSPIPEQPSTHKESLEK